MNISLHPRMSYPEASMPVRTAVKDRDRTRPCGHNRACKGFSLIEVLVALAIISILAGVVTISVLNKPAEARVVAARTEIQQLKTAVQIYKTDHGFVPTEQQGLEALVTRPATGPEPKTYPADGYLGTRRLPDDPWGNPYIYLSPGTLGETFEIISYGRDGEPGGENDAADISSSDL